MARKTIEFVIKLFIIALISMACIYAFKVVGMFA